jgi:hypothetical protein
MIPLNPFYPIPAMQMFPMPEDFELPEGVKVGDTFAAMAEIRLEAGNKLTLVSLEGSECGCGEEGDEESEDDGESGFVNQVEIKFGKASLD